MITAPADRRGAPAAARSVTVAGHTYPVLLPHRSDPRLHLAATIISLQVLGQVALEFELSIAQILVSLLTVAALELVIVFRRERVIAWPASAMLTGNGVAFVLRVPGTVHGDWWSMNGWYYFAGIAAVSLLSKYVIRFRGHHIFNPSNFGLVVAFVVLGRERVEPLDFWWGPLSPPVVLALAIIVTGGLLITTRLKMFGLAASFWLTFAASLAVLVASGHCMTARWRFGAICGPSFWWVIVTSPEILVFLFFMITDPKTTPGTRRGRLLFGVAVGFAAALFMAPQQTEYSAKVAVLASLFVACAARPVFQLARERRAATRARIPSDRDPGPRPGPDPGPAHRQRWLLVVAGGVVLALGTGAVALAGAPARRPPDAFGAAAETARDRPDIVIDAAQWPTPTIDAGVTHIDPDLTLDRARPMVEDFLADLMIEHDALQQGDLALAATAAAGVRLDAIRDQMQRAAGDGDVVASTYSFDRITFVLAFDPRNNQTGPQYAVEVHGTEHVATYTGSPATRLVGQTDKPIDRVHPLLFREGHYLIAADYTAPT